jgi:hypothetical protein
MIVEKQMECRLVGETEVLGENLPQRQFCPSQNPTWPDPGLNPGRRGGKPATNLLSYGAALSDYEFIKKAILHYVRLVLKIRQTNTVKPVLNGNIFRSRDYYFLYLD